MLFKGGADRLLELEEERMEHEQEYCPLRMVCVMSLSLSLPLSLPLSLSLSFNPTLTPSHPHPCPEPSFSPIPETHIP